MLFAGPLLWRSRQRESPFDQNNSPFAWQSFSRAIGELLPGKAKQCSIAPLEPGQFGVPFFRRFTAGSGVDGPSAPNQLNAFLRIFPSSHSSPACQAIRLSSRLAHFGKTICSLVLVNPIFGSGQFFTEYQWPVRPSRISSPVSLTFSFFQRRRSLRLIGSQCPGPAPSEGGQMGCRHSRCGIIGW